MSPNPTSHVVDGKKKAAGELWTTSSTERSFGQLGAVASPDQVPDRPLVRHAVHCPPVEQCSSLR